MTPELVKKLLAAIEGDDKDAALALCKDMLVAQATGDDAGAGGDESGGESDDDAAGNADALSNAGAEDDKDEEAMRAASVKLCALTGRQSVGEAVSAVENWSKRLEKIEKREATLELSARRELVAELVRLGVELPSTAWEGEPSDRKPCQRLSVEPIDALRSRVETFRAARPKLPKPPNSGGDVGGGGTMQLSQRELELCTRMKIDPKEYAINRAAIRRGKQ